MNTRILKGASELQRRLSAKGNHYSLRLFDINNVHNVFVSQRLEIKAIGRIVVSRYRFRIAVDHDGFIAGIMQCVACMHAAIVKLNALANAIWASAQNHSALLIGGSNLRIAQLICLVVILSKALKLGSTSINSLKDGNNTQLFTTSAYRKLVGPSQVCDLVIGKTELLCRKHIFS